jgi:MFS family permease
MQLRPAAPRDVRLLLATRILRLLAYGFLSVVLALHLEGAGLGERQIGLLLTLTLVGDTLVTLAITTSADRLGRRRMLVLGAALLDAFAGGFVVQSLMAYWFHKRFGASPACWAASSSGPTSWRGYRRSARRAWRTASA